MTSSVEMVVMMVIVEEEEATRDSRGRGSSAASVGRRRSIAIDRDTFIRDYIPDRAD